MLEVNDDVNDNDDGNNISISITDNNINNNDVTPDSDSTTVNANANANNIIDNNNGSSVTEAIFNFTNSIVGAGCIGLGGAIALSGGIISIVLVLFFAVLTKLSLDLLIRLSIQQNSTATASTTTAAITSTKTASYEDLVEAGMGYWKGRVLVMACKFSYSFGCLVAYIVVIKDNCGPALKGLLFGKDDDDNHGGDGVTEWIYQFLSLKFLVTWFISLVFILPLCLLRDMTPLAFASLISVASMVTIVGIVIYIYFECPDVRKESTGNFYENWIEIRPGVLSNLGTFIFTFVSQHTVHLVFGSLKPPLKTVKNFKIISSISILAAATVSLLVGVFVYITFWQDTKSDIFEIYPQGWMIDTAKLLLCVTMVFTFPLPFFTCRELLILVVIHPLCGIGRISSGNDDVNVNVNDADTGNNTGIEIVEEDDNDENDCLTNLQRPLLLPEEAPEPDNTTGTTTTTINAENINDNDVDVDDNIHTNTAATPTKNWLLPDDDRQLRLPGHAGITFTLWLIVTALAIAAPNLGDILDLTGCASGTLIAFVIPALLSFYIEGYNHLAMVIFTVGGVVGTVGTFYSIKQLIRDL